MSMGRMELVLNGAAIDAVNRARTEAAERAAATQPAGSAGEIAQPQAPRYYAPEGAVALLGAGIEAPTVA